MTFKYISAIREKRSGQNQNRIFEENKYYESNDGLLIRKYFEK